MKNWIKLYVDILEDPKMIRLSGTILWERVIELFLLVGKLNDGTGELPCTEDIAIYLRADTENLEVELTQLAEKGFITKTEDGWFVNSYSIYPYTK